MELDFKVLENRLSAIEPSRHVGRVLASTGGTVRVQGLSEVARLGDWVDLQPGTGAPLSAEVIQIDGTELVVLPEAELRGLARNDRVILTGPRTFAPCDAWLGRVIDPFGRSLDGGRLGAGPANMPVDGKPPAAVSRAGLGPRLDTGLAIMNTLLPLAEGQRVGLFAGSGVGKSSLLGQLARAVGADVVVVALIGERGREVREFVDTTLGPQGMARSVVVAATSDQSALARRRCAGAAMTVAEYFRDQGRSVLYLADSITRFAEAHREVALMTGEPPALRGHPPSVVQQITGLCERAGPGAKGQGTISAVMSVLVAGGDMDEPIADILRGVLDGHIVLDRAIAERGRFPAIDVVRSVSRSLPGCASDAEMTLIRTARELLGDYDTNATMIRAGLYSKGADERLDKAVELWPELDQFVGMAEAGGISGSFDRLRLILRRGGR